MKINSHVTLKGKTNTIPPAHSPRISEEHKRIVDSFPRLNILCKREDIRDLIDIIHTIQLKSNMGDLTPSFLSQMKMRLDSNHALPTAFDMNARKNLLNDLVHAAKHKSILFHFTKFKADAPVKYTSTIEDIFSKLEQNYRLSLNGELYIGDMRDGKRHGSGAVTYGNGDRYVGEWLNNARHGEGTMTFSSGMYKGQWKNGARHGKGTMLLHGIGQYVGNWERNKYSGNGTFQWFNGEQYEGNWKNDTLEGQGIFRYANGTQYVGYWHGLSKVPMYFEHIFVAAQGHKPAQNFFLLKEHREYVSSLKEVHCTQNKGVSDADIRAYLKHYEFDPQNLSHPQDTFFMESYIESLPWYGSANESIKKGIHNFIMRIQSDCAKPQSQYLMQEAWRHFGQFIYFMNNASIPERNKTTALNLFDGVFFACSESVPERMKEVVTALINNTSFADPFLSQRNFLLEKFVIDFMDLRRERNLPKLHEGFEIHVRTWLANVLSTNLNFHTSYISTTDSYATDQYTNKIMDTYLRRTFIDTFREKINTEYLKPEILSVTAHFTSILHLLKGKILEPEDFRNVNEHVFDVLKPTLEGKVPEFDDRLERYFLENEAGEYSLNLQIFVDLPYLVGRHLEILGYYQTAMDSDSCITS